MVLYFIALIIFNMRVILYKVPAGMIYLHQIHVHLVFVAGTELIYLDFHCKIYMLELVHLSHPTKCLV